MQEYYDYQKILIFYCHLSPQTLEFLIKHKELILLSEKSKVQNGV